MSLKPRGSHLFLASADKHRCKHPATSRSVQGLLVLLLAYAGPLQAEEAWRFNFTPYGWWPNFTVSADGQGGSPPLETDFQYDFRTGLEAGFLFYSSAGKGRHTVNFEFDWIDITTDATSRRPLFPAATVDWEIFVYTLGYDYRWLDTNNGEDYVDVGTGVRHWELDVVAQLDGRLLPDITIADRERWTDPYIALKGRKAIAVNNRLFVTGHAYYGGFDVGSERMIDLAGTIGYRFSPLFWTSVGYRHVSATVTGYELTQAGAVIYLGFDF